MGGILGDNLVARVIASQKLPRDSGETIFAARHQSVSQGPLGTPPCSAIRFCKEISLQHGQVGGKIGATGCFFQESHMNP